MPPALLLLLLVGQVERVLFPPPAAVPTPAVDTRLERGPVTRTVADAVTIEALPRDAADATLAEGDLAAPPEALARVREIGRAHV